MPGYAEPMFSGQKSSLTGRWESHDPGNPWLEFAADGTVTGSDGCNGIFSSYVATDTGATIAKFVSTLKACIGVNDWLRGIHSVQLRGDTLVVCDMSGLEIGELRRAAGTPGARPH